MAELSGLRLTLEQNDGDRAVRIVRVGYEYTLACSDVECERHIAFDVCIDILGHDLLRDDMLANGLDTHIVECGGNAGQPVAMRRNLLVGQSLLDEDIGTDEIKIRVRATNDAGEEISLTSGIVRGRF
jgi:hypothetical protein